MMIIVLWQKNAASIYSVNVLYKACADQDHFSGGGGGMGALFCQKDNCKLWLPGELGVRRLFSVILLCKLKKKWIFKGEGVGSTPS